MFPEIGSGVTGQSLPPHFSFSVDSTLACGPRIHFVISVTCDQGDFTDDFDMLVGEAQTAFFDDVETAGAWTLAAGDDDATLGTWLWADPKGSLLGESTFPAAAESAGAAANAASRTSGFCSWATVADRDVSAGTPGDERTEPYPFLERTARQISSTSKGTGEPG